MGKCTRLFCLFLVTVVRSLYSQTECLRVFVVYQITFQVKRVRKAKVDGTDSVASSDDSQNGESLPGGHSVLEISGPTIPSPGPSGTAHTCILFTYTSMKKSTEVLGLTQLREMCCGFCVFGQVAGRTTRVLAGQGQKSASGHAGSTSPL